MLLFIFLMFFQHFPTTFPAMQEIAQVAPNFGGFLACFPRPFSGTVFGAKLRSVIGEFKASFLSAKTHFRDGESQMIILITENTQKKI